MARPPAPAPRTGAGANKSTGAPSRPGAGAPPAGKSQKNATMMLAIATLLVLAIFERPICMLLVLALVPTMLAWLVDDTSGQSLIRTVAPLNLASVLPFAIKLGSEHNSLDQVFTFMSGSATWIALYGAAAFGWLLYYLAPQVIVAVIHRRIERMRDAAKDKQKSLKDEWGDDVER